nr:hypothetical protein [Acinetobacter baumannii]
MALTEVWLKANNGKARDKVEEIADRDSMSVRVSPKGKIVLLLNPNLTIIFNYLSLVFNDLF